MARNGAGTYVLPAGNPVVTGTIITSAWANGTLPDVGAEITNSVPRDGQAPPTANLPMGGFRHTGAQDPVTAQDYVTKNYLTTAALAFGVFPLNASSAALINGLNIGYALARLNTPVSAPADITEDTLWTVTIPANAMGPNGMIRIPPVLFSYTSNTNDSVAFRVKLDGTTIATYTTTLNTVGVSTPLMTTSDITITNKASAAAQTCFYDTRSGITQTTTAVDTTLAKTITVTVQKSVAGDTATINSGLVMIYPST